MHRETPLLRRLVLGSAIVVGFALPSMAHADCVSSTPIHAGVADPAGDALTVDLTGFSVVLDNICALSVHISPADLRAGHSATLLIDSDNDAATGAPGGFESEIEWDDTAAPYYVTLIPSGGVPLPLPKWPGVATWLPVQLVASPGATTVRMIAQTDHGQDGGDSTGPLLAPITYVDGPPSPATNPRPVPYSPPPIAPTVQTPNVAGRHAVGATLVCIAPYPTGRPIPPPTYQWLRGGTPIDGATRKAYIATSDDAQRNVSCRITATTSAGQAQQTSVAVTVYAAPSPIGPVRITGAVRVGARVHAHSVWRGHPTLRFQWYRGGTPIPGANGQMYTVRPADARRLLRCRITATNPAGTATATTAHRLVDGSA